MKVKFALAGNPDVSVIVDGASNMGGPWTRAARTRKQEAGALVHVAGRHTGRIRRTAPAGAPRLERHGDWWWEDLSKQTIEPND